MAGTSTTPETETVVRFAVDAARKKGVSLLLGALRKKTADVTDSIGKFLDILRKLTGKPDSLAALIASGVSGFTVCPPAGKDLDQETIGAALAIILDLGLPTALYQLPQVTGNETAPETFAKLVAKYPNLILFKDSSGADRIAQSGVNAGGVFLVRGAEGDYARWLRAAGGTYDGFLLSTANSFPAGLLAVVNGIQKGRPDEAAKFSAAISGAVGEVFGPRRGDPLRQCLHQRQQGDRTFHGLRPRGFGPGGPHAPRLHPHPCGHHYGNGRYPAALWPDAGKRISGLEKTRGSLLA